uniref:Uncharacterized protein n=1 Tax=Methylophaga nitratireducenticrescens TaxID=754476 RepID=I1XG06_METNJ
MASHSNFNKLFGLIVIVFPHSKWKLAQVCLSVRGRLSIGLAYIEKKKPNQDNSLCHADP